MSKESPKDDPRQETDEKTHRQTDKPWQGNPAKEQAPPESKPDLETWQKSGTH